MLQSTVIKSKSHQVSRTLNLHKGKRKGTVIPTFPGRDLAKIHSSLIFGMMLLLTVLFNSFNFFHRGVMVLR